MKATIITSLVALGTGLTGVLGAPVRDVNSEVATQGNELATVVTRGNGMIVERDEERKKKHKPKNPTWCGAPFCGSKAVVSSLWVVNQYILPLTIDPGEAW